MLNSGTFKSKDTVKACFISVINTHESTNIVIQHTGLIKLDNFDFHFKVENQPNDFIKLSIKNFVITTKEDSENSNYASRHHQRSLPQEEINEMEKQFGKNGRKDLKRMGHGKDIIRSSFNDCRSLKGINPLDKTVSRRCL
ncbi:hypothetical protein RF11_05743 [Thelohanellus kitauei]|uniref:Uncharacterized protein n=1 Tax=Thelohanellus kitauei TaxID=669202 RepID=A0A0C2JXP9_THEKT|nr:hypothetical protein RF11_05743 [Thelohanellus kitauei]